MRIGDVQTIAPSRLYPEDQVANRLKKGSEAKNPTGAHDVAFNSWLVARQVLPNQPIHISNIIHQIAPAATFQTLRTGAGETHLPHVNDPVTGMPFYDQGDTNGCGTTTLAMIMSYLGVHMTEADVDKVIRRMDIFTAPKDLIEFARDNGLAAEGYNHGSWEEVKSMLDQGYPVEALIQSDTSLGGTANGQHYIAITGYGTDATTGEQYVLCHDPNDATGERRIPLDDFEKMWGNVGFGFDNYFMAFGPKGAHLPAGRDAGIEGVLGTLDGVTNITNGLNRIYSPDSVGSFVHGIPQFFGGIAQTIGSGIGGALQLGGGWLHDAVDGIPVLRNVVQPFTDLVSGFGGAIADISDGFGEAADDVGNAFENLLHGDVGGFFGSAADAVGDVVGGVADAVGDVASAVGDAVSDFFSGW